MLVSSQLSQVPTVEHLISLWSDRYLPNLSSLGIGDQPLVRNQLRRAATQSGRAETVAKLPQPLIEEKCKLAAIQVKDLYDRLADNCDLKEVIRLSRFTSQVYLKLLELYQEAPSADTASKADLLETFGDSSLAAWGIPRIDKLAETLEPVLLDFQEQHIISKDWRVLGFITTQINYSSTLLAEQLTPAERVLISPYFTFVEEQVALPWQRICAATAQHQLDSPEFTLVKQMLPVASEVSEAAFESFYAAFKKHRSRRGDLLNSAVKHSCLRDFSMFQGYLWLCVLQGSLRTVEQELVALCVMVMESIEVPWQMTVKGTEILMEEILARLSFSQKELVSPYAEGMVNAFQNQTMKGPLAEHLVQNVAVR